MWGVCFFNVTAPTEIYTLSLHDALPLFRVIDGGPSAPLKHVCVCVPIATAPSRYKLLLRCFVSRTASKRDTGAPKAKSTAVITPLKSTSGVTGWGTKTASGLFRAGRGPSQHTNHLLIFSTLVT